MKKYAWVFVVWGSAKYIVGSLAAAQSLRRVKTRHDIVLVYAMHIAPATVAMLQNVFDAVICKPLLQFRCRDLRTERQRELYGGAFSRDSCTKWHCLSLVRYARVMYVDSDVVFQSNCDNLFELHSPAACFSNAFAPPYARSSIRNMYGVLDHGETVPRDAIARALRADGFVTSGTVVLVTPSAARFSRYVSWMRRNEPYGHTRCYSGIDEQSITEFMVANGETWTHMHQKYQMIPWKQNWWANHNILRDAPVLHYYHDKPWLQGESQGYDDIRKWWRHYHDFERAHPDVAKKFKRYITAYRE